MLTQAAPGLLAAARRSLPTPSYPGSHPARTIGLASGWGKRILLPNSQPWQTELPRGLRRHPRPYPPADDTSFDGETALHPPKYLLQVPWFLLARVKRSHHPESEICEGDAYEDDPERGWA